MSPFSSRRLAQQAAEKVAAEVILKADIHSLPVDPRRIAADHDISVEPMPHPETGISGFLMKSGDSFGIGYSTAHDNEGWVNFTIAHELGHYFLPGHVDVLFHHDQTCHFSGLAFASADPHEKEADAFAAALLMPEILFRMRAREVGQGMKAITSLARECGTSLTATGIRYAALAEDPLAVILSSGLAVEYCGLSEALAAVRGVVPFRRGDWVPSATPTGKFNAKPENAGTCREVGEYCSLDDWFEDAPQVEMKEDVRALGRYGKTLSILFTTKEIIEDDE